MCRRSSPGSRQSPRVVPFGCFDRDGFGAGFLALDLQTVDADTESHDR